MAGFLTPTYGGLLGGGMVKGNLNLGTGASNQASMLAEGFIPFALGLFLSKGDVIATIHPTDEGDDTTNIGQWFVVASVTAPTIQLTTFEAYAGSGLGNDVAGFDRTRLTGNMGVGGESFNLFAYENGVDTTADMLVADYFNDGVDILEEGDVICVSTNDGADLLKVVSISSIGEVVVVASDFSVTA